MLTLLLTLALHAAASDPSSGVCRYDYLDHGTITSVTYAECGVSWSRARATGFTVPSDLLHTVNGAPQ